MTKTQYLRLAQRERARRLAETPVFQVSDEEEDLTGAVLFVGLVLLVVTVLTL